MADTDFLGTPADLVVALLESIGVTPEQTLIDLGCGDGRVVVAAAASIGCRAVGVEIVPSLVERARGAVSEAGLGGRVEIRQEPIARTDVSDADVAFVFLPRHLLGGVLRDLRHRMRSGARIVVHEQAPLPLEQQPDQSTPVIAKTALTVAHVWTV